MHTHTTDTTTATQIEAHGANPKMSGLSDATLALIEQARSAAREHVLTTTD
jgi:hypothetical protein